MAGKELMMKARVSGSTIIEVIVSMVIIIFVFGIAMMIFANVLRSSLSVKKIKAEAILNESMLVAEVHIEVSSKSFTVDDFSIQQEIKNYDGIKDLFQIDLIAYDINQKKVGELHKIVLNKNE